MPGVPSTRACTACRAQKKKCDLKKPACSRCERLRIICEGSGVKRFKFIVYGKPSYNQHQEVSRPLQSSLSPTQLYSPNNKASLLCQATIARLQLANDPRFHLSWVWGRFIDFVPSHIGRNEALDAAVATLLSGHLEACSRPLARSTNPSGPLVTQPTVKLYCEALSELRTVLDDPTRCSHVETLCAVMIISVTQGRLEGPVSSWSSAHASGALRLLRLHKLHQGRDEFERTLYRHARSTVLLNSFINPDIVLTSQDYSEFEKSCSGSSIQARHERLAARVSELMTQTRYAIKHGLDTQQLANETRQLDSSLQQVRSELRDQLYKLDLEKCDPMKARVIHASYQRSYGLSLAIHAFFLCLRRAVFLEDITIERDAAQLCDQTLQLAEEAVVYRPLGTLWVVAALMPVWCGTLDESTRKKIEAVILDYRRQAWGSIGIVPHDQLGWMAKRLTFRS